MFTSYRTDRVQLTFAADEWNRLTFIERSDLFGYANQYSKAGDTFVLTYHKTRYPKVEHLVKSLLKKFPPAYKAS